VNFALQVFGYFDAELLKQYSCLVCAARGSTIVPVKRPVSDASQERGDLVKLFFSGWRIGRHMF
jgi:hypothetical protein